MDPIAPFLSRSLGAILKDELSRGNEVVEDSSWPPKVKRLVILAKPFRRDYALPGVEKRVVDDPHYWFAEYGCAETQEVLACRHG